MAQTSFDKELLDANLLDASTLEELYGKEKTVTNSKMIMLKSHPIEGELDYTHLKAIHYFLFGEVYSWAGKDRYEANITAVFGKGTTYFTSYDKLPQVSQLLFDSLKDEKYFRGLSKDNFSKSAAVFMNGLNILHPFREGNGRVQRIFVEYLAHQAGFELSFKEVSSEGMTLASIQGAKGDLRLMEKIFAQGLF